MNALKTILAVAAIVLPGAGFAQGYPERPITVVVPFPPGGNVDSAARIIAPKMEELLGQPIVVENRAGAGGMIASEYVKKASPDGYTLLMSANGPMLFAPITMNRPDAYDWKTDFELIGAVSITRASALAKPTTSSGTSEPAYRQTGQAAIRSRPRSVMRSAAPGPAPIKCTIMRQLPFSTFSVWRRTRVGYRPTRSRRRAAGRGFRSIRS